MSLIEKKVLEEIQFYVTTKYTCGYIDGQDAQSIVATPHKNINSKNFNSLMSKGFIFGKWFGTFILVIGMTIGATILYILSNYFFKEMIREKFLDRFKNLEIKFKKSEFIYLLVYRFIGGIPFALSNALPCIFNVKITNFFWATLIGLTPQLFLVVSIGSGLEKIIEQNLEAPRIIDLIYSPDIYIPMLAFMTLIIITIIAKKVFYKK